MKKFMLIAFATIMLVLPGAAALADTVSITSQANFFGPIGSLESTNTFAFKGPENIYFDVAGKACKLKGSGQGTVPMGCNYKLTVSPRGSISGKLDAGNDFCTQSEDIASSCQ